MNDNLSGRNENIVYIYYLFILLIQCSINIKAYSLINVVKTVDILMLSNPKNNLEKN